MFASNGDMTDPCGTPVIVAFSKPFSITRAFRYFRIRFNVVLSFTCSLSIWINLSWFTPIEKLLYIYIHYPFISIIQILQCLSDDGIVTASPWSKTIAVVTEYFFINIRYRLCYCLLDSPVKCCGYSQCSFLTIVFWNIYSPNWFRYIGSVSQRSSMVFVRKSVTRLPLVPL